MYLSIIQDREFFRTVTVWVRYAWEQCWVGVVIVVAVAAVLMAKKEAEEVQQM